MDLNAKLVIYSTDILGPSGRGDWWDVIDGATFYIEANRKSIVMMSLDDYVVARAEAGCPDCISAILECQRDELLLEALTYDICSPEIEVLVAELSHEAVSE